MRLLWGITGSDADLLEQSHASDRMKYSVIGISVLLTTVAAILSGSYAFHTIFKNSIISLILGIFWGLFIFNMDRLILLTTHKEKKIRWQQICPGISRFMVAFLIAVVIAKPLELKLFEKPILAEIAQENARVSIQVEKTLSQGMPEIGKLEAGNQSLEKTISEAQKNRDQCALEKVRETQIQSLTEHCNQYLVREKAEIRQATATFLLQKNWIWKRNSITFLKNLSLEWRLNSRKLKRFKILT